MSLLPGFFVSGARKVIVVGCFAAFLAGCGRRNEQAAIGQVVAHLGGEVITTSELDNEFRWANVPVSKQKDPEIIRKVLGELVLRKFLLQQAINAKLDREPSVLLDLLRAKDQVLATAYLNRSAAAKPPGKADIETYISANPNKFAKREALSVEQIVLPLTPDSLSIVDSIRGANSLDDIDQKLGRAGVPHVRQRAFLTTAELVPDLVIRIDLRQPEEVFYVRAGQNGVYFKVLTIEPNPLSGEAATEAARQALKADSLKAEEGVASFSAATEVRYEGDYAGIMSKGTASGRN